MRRYTQPVRKYLRKIWALLPCSFKEKHAILSTLAKPLQEYIATNPSVSYNEIKTHFGEPEEIIRSYFHHADSDALLKQWRFWRKISNIFLVAAVTVLIVLCIASPNTKQVNDSEQMEAPAYSRQAVIKAPGKATDIEKLEKHIRALETALTLADSSN